jgi:hypothetical protein
MMPPDSGRQGTGEWLTGLDYAETRYSLLKQIDTSNPVASA